MADSSNTAISKRNSSRSPKRSNRQRRRSATVGVEIGYKSIYIVQLKWSPAGGVVFEKCGTFEFDLSLDLESSEFASILRKALKQFSSPSKELVVWAAPQLDRARLHHIKVPKVGPGRILGAVYWALQREDSFLEDETVVDFQIDESDEPKAVLDVTGAIIERGCVDSVKKAFSQAGYSLSGIGLPLLALKKLVELNRDQDSEGPVLICQLGRLSTSVSVLLEGQLVFTRNIPSGLESLADTLVKELDPKVSQKEACEIILNLGLEEGQFSSDERENHRKAFALLQPVLDRTVRQIERTIDYFQSNFDTDPITTIFLGGEIAARGQLLDFFAKQLSPEVVAVDPFDLPGLQTKSSLPGEIADRVVYGTAFGLALEGSQAGINLAHTYKARQKEGKQNKLATVASILLLLLALAAALFYNTQRLKLRDLEAEKGGLEEEFSSLGPRLTESMITKTREEVRLVGERRKAAINRYEGLALLSEITRLTPENVSLLHVSAAMGSTITFLDPAAESANLKLGETSADEKGTLLLKGVVTGERTSLETSLTIYIARLDQSRLFGGIEVDSTELVQSEGKLRLTFTLNVETIAEVEIINLE